MNDGTVSSAAATVSITVNSVPDPPVAGNDAFSTVGNVELVAAELGDGSMPSGPAFVSAAGNVLANDSDPVEGTPITIVELQGDTAAPFTGTTSAGGTVTLLADGRFVYTPEAGDGTSSDPFSSLSDPGTMNDAEDVSTTGESILVFLGDGTADNQDQGITLEANQKLFGHSTATLLLGGITVQTPSPGARPKIDNVNVAGDGVTITDATGVEVAGLDISGTDNAVQIRSTIAGTFTASIHDNTISGAGSHGIDARTTAGELRLVLDANTGIAAGGSGVLLDSTGGGALFVTSFGGNGVDGATAADGLFANGVTFDADPGTPGFEEVVAGDGLKLTGVKGNLHFTQLDVFNTGGVAIQAVADTSGGTGFELSVADGQVESTGDSHGILLTDVGIDPTDDFVLNRIVSSGSTRGVELLRVLGGDVSIVDAGAASSLSSTGEAIRVEGGTSAVTFSGVSATRTTGGGAAIFGLNHDGSFAMTMGTITHSGGRAIDFDNMDGGSDFTGTTVSTTNHHGKRLVNSAGTHSFPAVVITTAPPAGVDALHLEDNAGTTNVGGLSVTPAAHVVCSRATPER
ncbi:MAG TPA: Ig-like domain-containing protein [Thermoanaerobaculia bacterium]|nr:Ig-like domain-containing protein [Thermoanaerobaculia bacterium]